MMPRPARLALPGRKFSPALVTDTDLLRSSTVQDASRPCDRALLIVWGCQQAGEYAIKGRLIHVTQPWFVFSGRMHWRYFVLSVRFDRWDHGFEGGCDVGSFLSP
jgi:hypothetical protein